ncbi:DNA-binding response regulator [Streptomyces chrestomyceticus JCM 4735]|uniref:DNA-binding response regulator n=1 Tax=Streptomyces chrestomyceticus JCM 4735 TaxID=1306181 RepID=A0A7U9L2C8_9ACTN|nr:DNA-binding response regulator [Streptomyces chrestomyceticus JCM 4735]
MVPANRIDELPARRADTTVAQAAEIRRNERHLHGGAKARLVPLGLSLATADRPAATAPTRPRRPPALSPNRRLASLTERELSVPGLIVEALSNQTIGQRLFLSESSISKRAASRPGELGITDDDSNNRRAHAVLNPPRRDAEALSDPRLVC